MLFSADLSEQGDIPLDRLKIYRNNILLNLLNALKITYPKVCKIVGENHFDDLVRPFCFKTPPLEGCLDAWGGCFPQYLASHSIKDKFPFLEDLAQFEWLKNQVFLLREQKTLGIDTLSDLMEQGWENWSVQLNPTVFLLESAYDFKQILDYVDNSIPALRPPYEKTTYLLGVRHQGIIQIHWLEETAFQFINQLKKSKSVLEALDQLPRVNLPAVLAFAFSKQLFTEIRHI
jgi:hypothetical protein